MAEIKYQKQAFNCHTDKDHPDCFRTTVANLLGLERDSVPNFFQDSNGDRDIPCKRINEFIRKYGLGFIPISKTYLDDCYGLKDLYHIVFTHGNSKTIHKMGHCVMAKDGEQIHDPSPFNVNNNCDLIGVFIVLHPWEKL